MSKAISNFFSAIFGARNNQQSNSCGDGHLAVAPAELIFCEPFEESVCQFLTLTNLHAQKRIAFRFEEPYYVKPSVGIIPPGDSVVVKIRVTPRYYIDRRSFLSSCDFKPEVVIEWLPIADAVVSSDGYEDAFIWKSFIVGLRTKKVKMLFRRKAIQVEKNREVWPVSTEMKGSEHLVADFKQKPSADA